MSAPGDVRCFMLQELLLERLWLRRYADGPCPANPGEYSYHHAMVLYRESAPAEKCVSKWGYLVIRTLEAAPADDDPRWPAHCECGFAFAADVVHQLFARQLYRRADNAEITIIEDAPAGAMWNAWWIADKRPYKGPGSFVGPDGISLMVKTPGGDWFIDGPANNGPGWSRTGTPPAVTANPSILIHARGNRGPYHGWLRDGVLVPC